MKKLNKKGFTLVELLAVIVVIALVLGLSAYGIISAYRSAKNTSVAISESSIVEAARIYSGEPQVSSLWRDYKDNEEYFCTSVKQLQSEGLLKKEIDAGELGTENFIFVVKDKGSSTIEKIEFVGTETEKAKMCPFKRYFITYYEKNDKSSPVFFKDYFDKYEGTSNSKYTIINTYPAVKNTDFVGWKDSETPNNNYKPSDEVDINSDLKLYPQYEVRHKVTVYFVTDTGSSISSENSSVSWSLGSSQVGSAYKQIKRDGEPLKMEITYGDSSPLYKYNSVYMNITKDNSAAVKGSEWKCVSEDCSQETYNQNDVYKSSDFCDASSSDCSVTLAVNWTTGEPNITPVSEPEISFYMLTKQTDNDINQIYMHDGINYKVLSESYGVGGYRYSEDEDKDAFLYWFGSDMFVTGGISLENQGPTLLFRVKSDSPLTSAYLSHNAPHQTERSDGHLANEAIDGGKVDIKDSFFYGNGYYNYMIDVTDDGYRYYILEVSNGNDTLTKKIYFKFDKTPPIIDVIKSTGNYSRSDNGGYTYPSSSVSSPVEFIWDVRDQLAGVSNVGLISANKVNQASWNIDIYDDYTYALNGNGSKGDNKITFKTNATGTGKRRIRFEVCDLADNCSYINHFVIIENCSAKTAYKCVNGYYEVIEYNENCGRTIYMSSDSCGNDSIDDGYVPSPTNPIQSNDHSNCGRCRTKGDCSPVSGSRASCDGGYCLYTPLNGSRAFGCQ